MLQVENSIWHAFDYLAVETGRTCASKSKLKVWTEIIENENQKNWWHNIILQVLTANLGHILDVKGTEQGLTDFKGTSTLTFDQFRYYVQTEVFSALPDQVNKMCETSKRDSCCPSDMICVLS